LLKRFCCANVYASSSPSSAIGSSASCTRDSIKSFQYYFCSKHHDVHAILIRVAYQGNVAMAIASLLRPPSWRCAHRPPVVALS
jgi:hypothetical protein